MRSQKRYSNVTFTKRVDHHGGEHRPARAPTEPATCPVCGAGYVKRRWMPPGDPRSLLLVAAPDARRRPCPACRTYWTSPRGFLHVSGAFAVAHREEIERLVEREAERASEDNPLARIVSTVTTPPDEFVVATTTDHLAQRLGHALHKAFSGKVSYSFSHENPLTRVTWHRDA